MTSKTKVDIKRLAKDMSLQDKAKLLFANWNKYIETSGLERILTQDELDAIYKDARENYQMDELKRLDKLHMMATLLLRDLQTAYLNFEIAYQMFIGMEIGMHLNENALDLLYGLIYDVAKTEKQKKALEKKWILEKYQKDLLVKDFSFTTLKQTAKGEINEETNISLISSYLPRFFTDTIERLKRYKKLKHQLDYVINEKVNIDFLSDEQKKMLKKYDDQIEHFLERKGFYSRDLNLYYKNLGKTIKRVWKSEFSQFLEMIKNIDKAVELTEQDKKEAREKIDAILNRHT